MSKTTDSQRRYYRIRTRNSTCKGKAAKPCRKIKSCFNTKRSDLRQNFCRKKTNTRRKR